MHRHVQCSKCLLFLAEGTLRPSLLLLIFTGQSCAYERESRVTIIVPLVLGTFCRLCLHLKRYYLTAEIVGEWDPGFPSSWLNV